MDDTWQCRGDWASCVEKGRQMSGWQLVQSSGRYVTACCGKWGRERERERNVNLNANVNVDVNVDEQTEREEGRRMAVANNSGDKAARGAVEQGGRGGALAALPEGVCEGVLQDPHELVCLVQQDAAVPVVDIDNEVWQLRQWLWQWP